MNHDRINRILALLLALALAAVMPLAAAEEASESAAKASAEDASVRVLGEVDIMAPEIRSLRNEETIPDKLTLGVRETYALSLEGKGIRYESSDTAVVSIKKNGVVKQ